jgi:6-phosphogluconolactonase
MVTNAKSEEGLRFRIEKFQSVPALAGAVARTFAAAVTDGLSVRNHASIILSGGRTPEIYLPHIAKLALTWDAISIYLSDERWVDEDSPHSNAALIRRTLLNLPEPSRARFVPLKSSASSPSLGASKMRRALPPASEAYDLALLGMGADGHFASLFPGMPDLGRWLADDNADRLVAVPPPTTAPPPLARVSMTAAEIKRARRIVLVLQGEEKLRVLNQAALPGDALDKPVRALGNVDVLWCP